MSNPYYQAGRERAGRVRRLFEAIAPRYDLVNDIQSGGLHRIWKRRLVEQLAVRPGERALDVCCGTGDVTFRLARLGACVVGVDFSLGMLRVARSRATRQRLDEHALTFIAADGLHLPFQDAVMDVVTISYGLRNLPDFAEGLREIWRVTRPGGRLGILDFGKPGSPAWRWIYFGYLRVVVPIYGRIFCGDAEAYGYILESLHHFPGESELRALLGTTGWTNVRTRGVLGGVMGVHWAERL